MAIIYKSTNTANGKVYIGQTWKSLNNRKGYHHRSKDCMCFSRAIQKYGKQSFKWEVLAKAETQRDLDRLEKHFIKKYNSTNPSLGYNIKEGGSHGKHNLSTKIKISRAKGTGKVYAKKNGTTIEFETQSDASEKLNLSRKVISSILNKNKKTINGWFFTYNKEETHPIEFLASDGNSVLYFQSQSEASKITKVNRRTICKRLLEKDKNKINGWSFWHEVYNWEDKRKDDGSLEKKLK